MTHIIAVTNPKGGVGKTTTCRNLADAYTDQGLSVCLVDNDAQRGSLSRFLRIDGSQKSLANIMKGIIDNRDIEELVSNNIVSKGTLDIIPSNGALVAVQNQLSNMQGAWYLLGPESVRPEYVLREITNWLAEHRRYDIIIIDCGSRIDMLVINAIAAANYALIPVQAQVLALDGMTEIIDQINNIKAAVNPNLTAGILMTMVQANTLLSKETIKQAKSKYPEQVLHASINYSIRVAELPAVDQSIFQYEPDNPAAAAYLNAAEEVLKICRDVIC